MARRSQFHGQQLHAVGVRYRLTGSGSFLTTLRSLDSVETVNLDDITMTSVASREPTIISNFISQRIQLQGRTDEINDRFTISRIAIFIKPISESYPIV